MPEDIISLYQSRLIPALLSQVMDTPLFLGKQKTESGQCHFHEGSFRHCLPELAPEVLNFDAVRRHRYE